MEGDPSGDEDTTSTKTAGSGGMGRLKEYLDDGQELFKIERKNKEGHVQLKLRQDERKNKAAPSEEKTLILVRHSFSKFVKVKSVSVPAWVNLILTCLAVND